MKQMAPLSNKHRLNTAYVFAIRLDQKAMRLLCATCNFRVSPGCGGGAQECQWI